MNRMLRRGLCLAILVVIAVTGCRPEGDPTPAGPSTPTATEAGPGAQAPVPAPPAAALEDVIQHDPRFVVGISFPPAARKYPGLALELQRYADAARAELMQAVEGLGAERPPAPYDLSLGFDMLVETPRIVAVAADGSSYTGGAHGMPLVARFVWLTGRDERLQAASLIPDPRGWREISGHVREQLHAALSQRLDADDLEPADRAKAMRQASRMIDEGSDPEAANFDQFEPVTGNDGRITALRFVFPPYQVGPYSDGVQVVEIPAQVLLPHVAAAYRDLFVGADAPA